MKPGFSLHVGLICLYEKVVLLNLQARLAGLGFLLHVFRDFQMPFHASLWVRKVQPRGPLELTKVLELDFHFHSERLFGRAAGELRLLVIGIARDTTVDPA